MSSERRVLTIRRRFTAADKAEARESIEVAVRRYRNLDDRKKRFAEACTKAMKALRTKWEKLADDIERGFVDEEVPCSRVGSVWMRDGSRDVVNERDIVPVGQEPPKQLDLFEEPAAIEALLNDRGHVELTEDGLSIRFEGVNPSAVDESIPFSTGVAN